MSEGRVFWATMKRTGIVALGTFLVAGVAACSYDWEGTPPVSATDAASETGPGDAAIVLDAAGECRSPADCPKSDEPACCYATVGGKTQSKCRVEAQCINQGGALLCQASSQCPASRPTCDLSLVPSGTCR